MSIGTDLLGAGTSAATGNYVGTAVDLIGAGLSAFGGVGAASVSSQIAGYSANEAQQEMAINSQKQMAMQLSSRRNQMEQIRNMQRQRAMGLQAAETGGATGGSSQINSGYAGGQAQVTSAANTNLVGIRQDTTISNNIFGFDNKISLDKMAIAQLQGQASTDQGIGAIGSTLMKSGTAVGNLTGQLFGNNGNATVQLPNYAQQLANGEIPL